MSMTKEEAFKQYEEWRNLGFGHSTMPPSEVLVMAMDTLRPITREQVEKVWRGEWIHAMPILGSGDEEIRCSKCGNIVGFETAFCPYCGSAKTEKAMQKVIWKLERLEGMKNG